ncbi:MAG: TIGR01777 family oxidoreductase [Verrucomicrobiota bacterium JB023]|nr:TIGR01777 family oxidoreductase [Verrucomicrobiota bacterium JB023]
MNARKLILPGGSGFLGRTLAKWFASRDWEVVVLSRREGEVEGARTVVWDGVTPGSWKEELEGATAVVNLAGRSVNCRYHRRNRQAMMASRVDSTRVLGEVMASLAEPPSVWLNSSTATIYRHRYDAANTEKAGLYGAEVEARDKFSLEVAHAWEGAFEEALERAQAGGRVRGVTMRTAMVFGREPGGVYETLHQLAAVGLGGKMGHGRQYVSWLHEEDFCQAIDWLIRHESAEGVYNLTAPEPLPNAEMMALLRKATGRGFGLPASRWMLRMGAFLLRTETELVVKSRRVVPERLLAEGFRFRFKTMEEALADLAQPETPAQSR